MCALETFNINKLIKSSAFILKKLFFFLSFFARTKIFRFPEKLFVFIFDLNRKINVFLYFVFRPRCNVNPRDGSFSLDTDLLTVGGSGASPADFNKLNI